MIKRFFASLVAKNKDLIYREGRFLNGFFHLLFKQVNTGEKWTPEEIILLRKHFLHLTAYIPVFILFLLPGGSLLLPFVAEVLDRRKGKRDDIQA